MKMWKLILLFGSFFLLLRSQGTPTSLSRIGRFDGLLRLRGGEGNNEDTSSTNFHLGKDREMFHITIDLKWAFMKCTNISTYINLAKKLLNHTASYLHSSEDPSHECRKISMEILRDIRFRFPESTVRIFNGTLAEAERWAVINNKFLILYIEDGSKRPKESQTGYSGNGKYIESLYRDQPFRDIIADPNLGNMLNEKFVFYAGSSRHSDTVKIAKSLGIREFPFFSVLHVPLSEPLLKELTGRVMLLLNTNKRIKSSSSEGIYDGGYTRDNFGHIKAPKARKDIIDRSQRKQVTAELVGSLNILKSVHAEKVGRFLSKALEIHGQRLLQDKKIITDYFFKNKISRQEHKTTANSAEEEKQRRSYVLKLLPPEPPFLPRQTPLKLLTADRSESLDNIADRPKSKSSDSESKPVAKGTNDGLSWFRRGKGLTVVNGSISSVIDTAIASDVVTVSIRAPSGEKLQRRFFGSDKAETILIWLDAAGIDIVNNDIVSTHLPSVRLSSTDYSYPSSSQTLPTFSGSAAAALYPGAISPFQRNTKAHLKWDSILGRTIRELKIPKSLFLAEQPRDASVLGTTNNTL